MAIFTPGVVPASQLLTFTRPGWLQTWSEFAASLTYEDLPAPVIERTRLVILDCLGAIIAGCAEPEVRQARETLRGTAGETTLITALLGGTAGTMLEVDEGNQYARGHPGIHVVPAIMAAANTRQVTGKAMILATALGYEIGARIGIASKLKVTMHPHGTWGVVGAAMAIAKIGEASAEQMACAINVASSLGLTTSRRTMLEGATVRNTYAGVSNMLGLIVWDLVRAGFTGETDGVGSVYGGIAADDWRAEEMTRDLGTRWEIARNYFKRHAACRYNHGALDALEKIVAEAGGRIIPDDVESIAVDTYVWAAQLDHPAPPTMLAAKFSMPFSIATAIVNGAANLDAFRDAARTDPTVTALAAKVIVNEDPALTAKLPGLRPARVRVLLKNGRRFEAGVDTNKGDTEDPYSKADVIAKFTELVAPRLGGSVAQRIVDLCLSLENEQRLSELNALCEVR